MELKKSELIILKKLESLAMAGYYFRDLYSSKILVATLRKLPLPEPCIYPVGQYVLGPEKDKLLLFRGDIFNQIDTCDISQTATAGVVQIITQQHVGYVIHLNHDTLPEDVKYSSIDLQTYNRFREKFRA